MNKFGILKTKILQKFTDAYANGNKSEIKKILKLIKENEDFRKLYLFYEEIENKYIEDKNDAELFINSIVPILKEHKSKITKFSKDLNQKIGENSINENTIYSFLDTILEDNTLKNIDTKINARKKLVEHLIKPKEIVTTETIPIIENEALLHSILTNNFNILYGSTLTEEEQAQLKEIVKISTNELETNFKSLQEDVIIKMTEMINEEKNQDLKSKLITASDEAKQMKPTKYNYYKLQQLKNGL